MGMQLPLQNCISTPDGDKNVIRNYQRNMHMMNNNSYVLNTPIAQHTGMQSHSSFSHQSNMHMNNAYDANGIMGMPNSQIFYDDDIIFGAIGNYKQANPMNGNNKNVLVTPNDLAVVNDINNITAEIIIDDDESAGKGPVKRSTNTECEGTMETGYKD